MTTDAEREAAAQLLYKKIAAKKKKEARYKRWMLPPVDPEKEQSKPCPEYDQLIAKIEEHQQLQRDVICAILELNDIELKELDTILLGIKQKRDR